MGIDINKIRNIRLEDIKLEPIKVWVMSLDKKTVITYGIILVAFLIFLFFFFLPIMKHNSELSQENKKLTRRARSATSRIARIPEMKKQKDLYGSRIKEIRAQFFDAEESDQLIEVISALANQSGIRITSSRSSKNEYELPGAFSRMYVAVGYDLTISGQYHQIGTFLNSLEQYPENFAVYDLKLARTRKSTEGIECAFTLTAFLNRPKAAIPGGPPGRMMPGLRR